MLARRQILHPEAEQAMERFKYEVAAELGLADKVSAVGWAEMTTRECGLVGGMMVKKLVKMAADQIEPS